MKPRASLLLPHGLDDLRHGIEFLLTDCPEDWLQSAADRIVAEVDGIGGTAAGDLCMAVARFAAWPDDGAIVRAAFQRFAVDAGGHIGAQNQYVTRQRDASVIRATAATEKTDTAIEIAMVAAISSNVRNGRRFATVADAIRHLTQKGMPAGLSADKVRRRLPLHKRAAEWVSTLPKSHR